MRDLDGKPGLRRRYHVAAGALCDGRNQTETEKGPSPRVARRASTR